MINKKDYLNFFHQLYDLEIEMEKSALNLKKLIENDEARKILDHIIREEREHKKIVQGMIDLVK